MDRQDKTYYFRKWNHTEQEALLLYQLMQDAYLAPSNWSQSSFLQDMQSKFSQYYVVEVQGQVVGFIALQVILGEATITNIAIAKSYQRKGLAKRLWRFVADEVTRTDYITVFFLEVRASNTVAQRFYETNGFVCYFDRVDYYDQPKEDAKCYRFDVSI